MYLSRLTLEPRSRPVRRDIADRHGLHRTVMAAFPDDSGGRATLGVLFRIEIEHALPLLYVQSNDMPDWSHLPEGYLHDDWLGDANPAVRDLGPAWSTLTTGRELRFRLQANPSKRVRSESAQGTGPRVPLRGSEECLEWLRRKAGAGGFELIDVGDASGVPAVRAVDTGLAHGWRPHGDERQRLTISGVRFDGRLRIVDATAFLSTLGTGIGPGKAYGFGLLSIAP